MAMYFKSRFLFSKIVATAIIISLLILTQYSVISNTLNGLLVLITLILFFVVDSNLRKMNYPSNSAIGAVVA